MSATLHRIASIDLKLPYIMEIKIKKSSSASHILYAITCLNVFIASLQPNEVVF
uniref:Uncharacterized protein n=1 Tax=Anguilla anguilla TaxID=7936 RepID=A0A0E9TPI9_ANGAN